MTQRASARVGLTEVLIFGDNPLDIALREALMSGKLIPYGRHPSAHQACRIPCASADSPLSTRRLAVLRLHGRNEATWNINAGAASVRFNYDYSDEELVERCG